MINCPSHLFSFSRIDCHSWTEILGPAWVHVSKPRCLQPMRIFTRHTNFAVSRPPSQRIFLPWLMEANLPSDRANARLSRLSSCSSSLRISPCDCTELPDDETTFSHSPSSSLCAGEVPALFNLQSSNMDTLLCIVH